MWVSLQPQQELLAVGHQCGPLFLKRQKSAVNYSNADVRVDNPAGAASVAKVTFPVRNSAPDQETARIRSEVALTCSLL